MAAQNTTQSNPAKSEAPPVRSAPNRAADIIARIAMGLAATALFVGLYMQFDMAFWLAITAALSTYIALVLVHAYVRRSDQVTDLTSELSDLRAEVERLKALSPQRPPSSNDDAGPSLYGAPSSRAQPQAAPTVGAPNLEAFRPRDFARDFASAMAVKKPTPLVVPEPMPAASDRGPPPSAVKARPGPGEMQEYWSFRPAAVAEPAAPMAREAAQPSPPLRADASPFAPERGPPMPASVQPPSDLEYLQEQIKKLADTVNAAEASPTPPRPFEPLAVTPPPAPEIGIREDAIDQSVKALRSASHSMRGDDADLTCHDLPRYNLGHHEFAPPSAAAPAPELTEEPRYEVIAATPGPSQLSPFDLMPVTVEVIAATPPVRYDTAPAKATPVAPAPLLDRTEAFADAIANGSLDVFLEPILGLSNQRAEHYELSVRLRDGAGGSFSGRDAAAALSGTDILTAFDVARLERTTLVANRLAGKGKSGSLFSEFSGAALSADSFLTAFSDAYDARPSFGQQLVLSFTQADVRTFGESEWMTLIEMRDYGFRFAVADVVDLDMDFAAIAAKGFSFVKLDQDVFLDGLPVANTHVPADDLCRHFAGLGQTIIVDGLDDGMKHAKIFGFGVLLGQGQLFGGPRPVKADVLKAPADAAA